MDDGKRKKGYRLSNYEEEKNTARGATSRPPRGTQPRASDQVSF